MLVAVLTATLWSRVCPAEIEIPITVGDGWNQFMGYETVGNFTFHGPFLYTSDTNTVIRVTDLGVDYERYTIFDWATPLGTSSVPARRGLVNDNADSTYASAQWSHGAFTVGPGNHRIYVQVAATGPGDLSGFARGAVRADLPGSFYFPVPVQFSVASNFNGEGPSLVVADFNKDGKQDIITANGEETLGVLLGDGNGGFALKTNYTIGLAPRGLAVGDLDGDGFADAVATRLYGNAAIVLRGLGDGSFAPASYQPFNASGAGGAVLVADLNNDQALDLVANYDVGFATSLGRGDGTFSNAVPQFLTFTKAIAAGDFNHDQKLDLALPYPAGKTVAIVLGNGDGTFGAATNVSVPSTITDGVSGVAATDDFDHDGHLDLVVAQQATTNSLTIFRGDGSGGFLLKTNSALGFGVNTLATEDLNGDTHPDLAVGGAGSVHVLLGHGDATFGPPVNFPIGGGPVALVIADLNSDGLPDIVSENGVLLNPTFPPLHLATAGQQAVLSWPTYAFGFQLETTTNCADAASWSAVGGNPTVVGTANFLTNLIVDVLRFYRLRR